jgi:hypothetical protein
MNEMILTFLARSDTTDAEKVRVLTGWFQNKKGTIALLDALIQSLDSDKPPAERRCA